MIHSFKNPICSKTNGTQQLWRGIVRSDLVCGWGGEPRAEGMGASLGGEEFRATSGLRRFGLDTAKSGWPNKSYWPPVGWPDAREEE